MNRFIKRTMILALALAMSLGAWAQQERLLTTVTATGYSSYSQSPDGIVTVTLNNISDYDEEYGWLWNGTVTVAANQGYTITRCVFRQNDWDPLEDNQAPFTATMVSHTVYAETSTGQVIGGDMDGITSIDVYGYAADPSPTVTFNAADSSWGFTMPDYNAALNVTYYGLPALAWVSGNDTLNNTNNITLYRGFDSAFFRHDLKLHLSQAFLDNHTTPGVDPIHYGSSNESVVVMGESKFEAVDTGTATLYAVFDGDDDFLRDSAFFTVNILNPDTLTLSANGNGTVSPLLGGNAVWTTETWADQTANQNLSPFTIGDITLTATANGTISKVESSGKLYFFIRKNNDEETLTFSSNGGNFSRIEMTCNNSNPFGGVDQEGWTVTPIDGGGSTAVWEGDAASVTFASCTTLVSQINFYRTGSTDIVASTTEDQYLVIPGATVQAVAEAQDGNYVQAWSDNRQPGNYTSDTNTITVDRTMTLTATFAQNPLLTLATNDGGTVELDGYTPGGIVPVTVTIAANGNTKTVENVNLPHTFSCDFWSENGELDQIIKQLYGYGSCCFGNAVSGSSNVTAGVVGDNHYFTISAPFEGTATVSGQYQNNDHTDFFNYNLTISVSPTSYAPTVYPDGVAAGPTENTYRVLPGTTVNVTATPAEGSYLAQWSDGTQTEPVAGDARLGGSHPYTMPAAPATLTATFNEIPVLTLASNNSQWGSVTIDGYTPSETTYDITIEGGKTYTNVTFPYTTTVSLHNQLMIVNGANPVSINSFESYGSANVTITISAPFDGSRTISYYYDEIGVAKPGSKTITCTANQSDAVYPDGVTAGTTANTYRVLPGTQVKVIATPDSAHYFVNWDEETALNSNTAVEKTLTMGTAPATLTANFAAKPTLTLAQNESQWGNVSVANGNEVENMNIGVGGSLYTGTHFNLAYTAHKDYTHNVAGFTIKENQDATLTATDGKVIRKVVLSNLTGNAYNESTTSSTGTIETEQFGSTITINDVNATELVISNSYSSGVTATSVAVYYEGEELPAGVTQLTDNTYRVDYNTEVTVQAAAAALHHVANWEDQNGTELTGATYSDYFITEPENLFPAKSAVTLTLTGDTTARALFGINSYDVTATVAESDDVRGTVSAAYTDPQGAQQSAAAGASLTLTAQGGSTTTLTATATDPGYHFVQWIDQNNPGTTSTQNPLTVTEAGSYTATFDTNSYQIGGSVAEGSTEWGSVEGSGEYRHFTTATLTAMPIEHYHFVQWEDGNTDNPRIIDVTGEESHEATFAIDRFTVSWSSNDETMGVVVGPYDNHTTGNPIPRLQGAYGTTFQLTASPAEHHMLDHWSTGQTTNVITVTITEDAEIVAYFKHVPYSVSVASADETMGTVSGSQESVEWQASTEISATANYGYHFVQWSDGNTANPRTVTINEEHDYSFTAQFAKNQYTVTVVTGDATRGSVSGTTTVDYLTDVEISATANEHYHFEQWNDGNMQNPRTVTVTANATYRAYFAPDKYTVTGLADQGQGSVTGSGSYAYLSNATLTAEPACGYLFDHWSNESTESTITFQVTGEMSYTAFFRPAVVETVEIHDTVTVTETVTVHDTTYIDIHDSIDVTVHVHDTTIVEVPVYVHDTTTVTVTDTVEVEVPVEVTVTIHDTTFVNVPVHDTVYVSDGTIIYVHDTTTVEVPVNVYVHDTTTVEVQVPVYVHDTTTIEVQVPVYVYDTTTVYDTTVVEVPVHDTTTVYDTTVVEVPVHDTTTVTEYEYIHDTVEVTVIVHDTIFIHDTIFVGIEGVDALDAKIYGHNGQIVVEGADFNEVILFDVNGRILARRQDEGLPLRFDIPASGAYLVKIGNHAARRIVMIR